MKFLFFFGLLWLAGGELSAQSSLLVLDDSTSAPVAGAHIWIPAFNLTGATSAGGIYVLPAFSGSLQILVTAEGYESTPFQLSQGEDSYSLRIKSIQVQLDEVLVRAPYFALPHFESSQRIVLLTNTIETIGSANLAEKLTRIPGVTQISTGPGIGKPVIRGLG
ncbi:MAG: hypothetical protein JNM00_09205, partial [Flavobacteriales bacterium]|nr:hypothetical protein [Flavobacteriales bacterium]